MKILFIGDTFGNVARRILAERLSKLIDEKGIELCIANGENIAGGRGITGNMAKKLRKYGVQVITGGNHSFTVPDNDFSFMNEPWVLRPHNFPPGNIGKGFIVFELPDGRKAGVLNLQGRTFFNETIDCPFRTGDDVIAEMQKQTNIIIVDFHGEATSEKLAYAYHVDGRVSAVIGTHTHVQTADERILTNGTAYISDVGMTGPEVSIIGMKPQQVIHRFIFQTHARFEPSEEGPMLNAVVIDLDDSSGKARSIERIYERVTFEQTSM